MNGAQSSGRYEEKPEFPGSRSKFIHKLHFLNPDEAEGIPVYRVMNRKGEIIEESEDPKVCAVYHLIASWPVGLWLDTAKGPARLASFTVTEDEKRVYIMVLIFLAIYR